MTPSGPGATGDEAPVVFSKVASGLKASDVDIRNSGTDLSTVEQIMLADARVRRNLAYVIMALFGAVNLATLVFVYLLFRVDEGNLAQKLSGPGDRIVNAKVLMTLLGATTVQLGSAMLIMARFVFRPVDRGAVRAD